MLYAVLYLGGYERSRYENMYSLRRRLTQVASQPLCILKRGRIESTRYCSAGLFLLFVLPSWRCSVAVIQMSCRCICLVVPPAHSVSDTLASCLDLCRAMY